MTPSQEARIIELLEKIVDSLATIANYQKATYDEEYRCGGE
jgi:hypothetical protein